MRELGGDSFFLGCGGWGGGFVWESGKRNMDSTTVFFILPNAHHVFGSRTGFSHSLALSGVSLGGSWIVFWCFGEAFSSPGGEG